MKKNDLINLLSNNAFGKTPPPQSGKTNVVFLTPFGAILAAVPELNDYADGYVILRNVKGINNAGLAISTPNTALAYDQIVGIQAM